MGRGARKSFSDFAAGKSAAAAAMVGAGAQSVQVRDCLYIFGLTVAQIIIFHVLQCQRLLP